MYGTRTGRIPSVLGQLVHFAFFVLIWVDWFFRKHLNLDLLPRPGWFIHENVQKFPGEYLQFDDEYNKQETSISPQRFGKPMNRQGFEKQKKSITFPLIDHLSRLRVYRLFYDKSKYIWRGPDLRTILKATLPHQPLRLTADHLYFLEDDELVPTLYFSFSPITFQFFGM